MAHDDTPSDITRVDARALPSSEEQFRLLVQGVTDYAIYMLDAGGHVASWNAGAERIKGYNPEEIIGSHFSRFHTEEDVHAGMPAVSLRIAAAEGRYEKEGWRVRKSGDRFWAHVIIDAIRNPDGSILGFAKITRDITERREAQRALEQAQQALFQSQKLESIGQLTGGIAHDFNNLLTAILGSLELLRKRMPDDPKAVALLDNAVQGARRGATLTQRMLAFARRQELKTEAVDLRVLVENMMGLLERSIGPSISIRTQFPPNLPLVKSDASQLDSALLNLAVNARDAMPQGGIIMIKAQAEIVEQATATGMAPGHYVRLAVTDTGTGMDAATLDRAMEPFFTTKGVGKGTGLGLSMIHGLAEQSGGKLILLSPPGEGLTAELWLPVTEDLATPADPQADPPEAKAKRLTILAVDDDDLVLMNTVAMLEDLGHEVVEAGSGAAALQAMSRHPDINMVISDQAMPGMAGVELAAAVRKQRPDMPIILATGFAELPPGADASLHRLAKPFNQAQLAQAVEAVQHT